MISLIIESHFRFAIKDKKITFADKAQHCSLKAAKRWDSQPTSKSRKSVAVPVLPK
jgi:hypothetical protein